MIIKSKIEKNNRKAKSNTPSVLKIPFILLLLGQKKAIPLGVKLSKAKWDKKPIAKAKQAKIEWLLFKIKKASIAKIIIANKLWKNPLCLKKSDTGLNFLPINEVPESISGKTLPKSRKPRKIYLSTWKLKNFVNSKPRNSAKLKWVANIILTSL